MTTITLLIIITAVEVKVVYKLLPVKQDFIEALLSKYIYISTNVALLISEHIATVVRTHS